jgi:glutamine cyclotransferase
MRYIISLFTVLLLVSCNTGDKTPDENDPVIPSGIPAPAPIGFTIISKHPHDSSAYTQGLEIHNGKLYEGTGDYETSSLRITDWKTGIVEKKHLMGSQDIFGEGITVFNNKIYQLTWESNVVYQYDISNIEKPVKKFEWPYEGWGITHNDKELIVSDGSSNLYIVDPESFRVKSTISVNDNNGPVRLLNELEYVNGYVYANVYQTNYIVKIDFESGHVVGKINLQGLLPESEYVPGRTDVLNGIAYDSASGNFLITGKRWPRLFEMKLN